MSKKTLSKKVRRVTSTSKTGMTTEPYEVEKSKSGEVVDVGAEHPVTVEFKFGVTIELQPYNFLRADAGITIPCKPKDVDKAFATAVKRVEKELDVQLKRMRKKYVK